MAIRRRELHPDTVIETRGGRQIAVVSESQYLEQLVDLGRFQMFAGGVIQSVIFRAPTDLDGEMVTVGGVLEWKDRTDAKAQPEPAATSQGALSVTGSGQVDVGGNLTPEEIERLGHELGLTEEEQGMDPTEEIPTIVHEEDPSPRAAEPAPPASGEGIEDGLEAIDPDAVDESEIPEHARS